MSVRVRKLPAFLLMWSSVFGTRAAYGLAAEISANKAQGAVLYTAVLAIHIIAVVYALHCVTRRDWV